MVSFKRLFCWKYILPAIILSMFPLRANSGLSFNPQDVLCITGHTKCCVNGKLTCCEDNGTVYDTSCGGGCSLVGSKEYKYTASGCSYTTQTRTCCSGGSWSGWGASCPTIKNCTGTKPATSQSCYGGKRYRSVTCNTSTGQWSSGDWGKCDCSDSAFKTVTLTGGGTCCERIDGTGMKCHVLEVNGHRWTRMGTTYGCTGTCPVGTPSEGASCPESWAGSFCTVHSSYTNRGEEICVEYYCS